MEERPMQEKYYVFYHNINWDYDNVREFETEEVMNHFIRSCGDTITIVEIVRGVRISFLPIHEEDE
jgi:hypothetical protein